RDRVLAELTAQYQERAPSIYQEFRSLGRDGREVWIGQRVQLVTEGRRVHCFQAVARDITERRRAESAMEREREQLRHIVAHAPVAMAVLDREARFIATSRRWLRYWTLEGQA